MTLPLNLAGRRLLELIDVVERADARLTLCHPQADAVRALADRDDLAALDSELGSALTAALAYGAELHQQRRQLELVVQDAAGPASSERLGEAADDAALTRLRQAQVALDNAFSHLRSAERADSTELAAGLAELRGRMVEARTQLEDAAGRSHLYLDALDEALGHEFSSERPRLALVDAAVATRAPAGDGPTAEL
jgi:hypothetical protein